MAWPFTKGAPAWVRDPLWRTADQRPSFDLDFTSGVAVNRGTLAPGNLGTFTRPSSVKLVWDGTQFVSVAADTPALQRDPVSGLWGVLMEPVGTNELARSSELNQAVWDKSFGGNLALVTGSNSIPGLSGNRLTRSANASNNVYAQSFSIAAAQATVWALVERTTSSSEFGLRMQRSAYSNRVDAVFTLTPGAGSVRTAVTGTPTGLSASMVELTQIRAGLFLCALTSSSASAGGTLVIGPTDVSQATTTWEAASSVLSGVIVHHCQAELGPVATSPIVTSGSALTRNADSWIYTGTAFSDWYDQAGGSLYASTSSYDISAASRGLVAIGDNTPNNYVRMFRQSNFAPVFTVASGGVQQANNGIGTDWTTVARRGMAMSWAVNDVRMATNGTQQTDTSASLPVAVSRMYVGAFETGGSTWNGLIHRLTYFPPGNAQSRIQQLSAL